MPSYQAKTPITARDAASPFATASWNRFSKPVLFATLGPAAAFLCTKALGWSPLPTLRNMLLLLACWGLGSLLLSRFVFTEEEQAKRPWMSPALLAISIASLLTLAIGLYKSPYLARLDSAKFEPFVPNFKNWTRISFYYAMGAVPAQFDGKPVFYSLPYAKGPPAQFPEEVVARWSVPKILLRIEGPKTPGEKVAPKRFRECMDSGFSPSCFSLKEDLFRRHVIEITKRFRPDQWSVKWFDVQHPALGSQDTPKGLYLKAENENGIEERYVVITARGSHQSFILERDRSPEGDQASERLQEMIRALRVTDSLTPGKRQAAENLAQTELPKLMKIEDPIAFVNLLSNLQLTLLSKFTVDPKDLFSVYHLGGTAVLFLRKVIKNRNKPNWVAHLTSLDEWSAAQKGLIRSASLYAQDIAPQSKEATQLRVLWLEAQKL